MTFAPPTIRTLAAYWVAQGGVNLGIVGDTAHLAKGTSYHLGKSNLLVGAYSARTARDKAGLTEAASALDLGRLGGSLLALRQFSLWFAKRCQANAAGTRDVREVIFALDGTHVVGWSREAGVNSAFISNYGDSSHLTHTHISFYRDSEFRSKLALFTPYPGFIAVPDTSTGDTTVSYPVPSAPSTGFVAKGKVIYTTDALLATDPNRIIIDPGRDMPYFGQVNPKARIVEYINASGVHSGKSYFVATADLTNIKPIPLAVVAPPVVDTTPYSKAQLDAAVSAATVAGVAQGKTFGKADEAARIRGVLGI